MDYAQKSKFHFLCAITGQVSGQLHSTGFSVAAPTHIHTHAYTCTHTHTHTHTHTRCIAYTQVNKAHTHLVDWLPASWQQLDPNPGSHTEIQGRKRQLLLKRICWPIVFLCKELEVLKPTHILLPYQLNVCIKHSRLNHKVYSLRCCSWLRYRSLWTWGISA